jgi:hypothetical protein
MHWKVMALTNKHLTASEDATAPHLASLNSISAMERAPREMWAEIFMRSIYCPSGLVEIRSDSMPLRLRQVCRYWKQTADSTPTLWTSMTVSSSNMHSQGLRAIKAWLERSGSLGLTITIGPVKASQHMVDDVMAIILSHSERLVYLSLPAELSASALCADVQLPQLQTLALYMPTPMHLRLPSSTIRLRDVTLMLGSPFLGASGQIRAGVLNPVDVHLGWEQLTRLTLRCFTGSIDTFHNILLHCSRLNFLSLDGCSLAPSRWQRRLRHLTLKSIHLLTENDPTSFLDSLILPSLDTVHIDVMSPIAAEFSLRLRLQIVLLSWLSGFRTLILNGLFITERDLMWLALISPSIKNMSIMYDGNDLVTERVTGMLMRTLNLSYLRNVSRGTSISIHLGVPPLKSSFGQVQVIAVEIRRASRTAL